MEESRPVALLRLTAVALALALAPVGTRGAPRELVVWNSTSLRERTAFARVIDAYNARKGSAGVHVTMVPVAWDGFADRIARAIPAGKGPDVFIYAQDRLGGWVESGHTVEPIDRLLDASARHRFIPATLEALTYDRAVYGLPLAFKVVTLYYNKKLVPEPPRTTAELEALAVRLTNRQFGKYGLAYPYTSYYYHAALQNGFGGAPFDEQRAPTLARPENVSALKLLVRWKRDFLPDESVSQPQMENAFNDGRVAMLIEGPWFQGDIAPGIDYGMAPLPTISEARDQPMRPWMTVDGLFIAAGSTQKELAYDFMRFATDLESARVLALDGASMPANQQVYVDGAVMAREATSAFFRQLRVAVPMPNTAAMTVLWGPADEALRAAVREDATAWAALHDAQEAVTSQLAQLAARARGPR